MSSDITVGALAARTGLTVRTLHHYDSIGLLSPSGRTEAGYRLYAEHDVGRLEAIVMLRSVGLSLGEIAAVLAGTVDDLRRVLDRQLTSARQQADEARTLVGRLDDAIERLRSYPALSVEGALATIEAGQVFEKYFDRGQLDDLREHARELGADVIREVEQEWPRLIAAVRCEMERGTDPHAPEVQPLARRWRELVDLFVNGRFDIAAAAGRAMHAEPSVRRRTGLTADMMEYVGRATAALSR